MSDSRRRANRGFLDYDPKTDLSPRFIFWFTFAVYFTAWTLLTIWILGSDYSTPEVIYDDNGIPVDYDAWSEVIFRGKIENSDFPMWGRIMVSLFLGGYFIVWMVRIQIEMWILRKASRKTRRWLNE
jgi:hypothetical protein